MLKEFLGIRALASDEIAHICTELDASLELFVEGKDKIDTENQTHVSMYEIWTDHYLNRVENVVYAALKNTECSHNYDCCGCFKRSKVKVYSLFDREGIAYIILDYWSRNI